MIGVPQSPIAPMIWHLQTYSRTNQAQSFQATHFIWFSRISQLITFIYGEHLLRKYPYRGVKSLIRTPPVLCYFLPLPLVYHFAFNLIVWLSNCAKQDPSHGMASSFQDIPCMVCSHHWETHIRGIVLCAKIQAIKPVQAQYQTRVDQFETFLTKIHAKEI